MTEPVTALCDPADLSRQGEHRTPLRALQTLRFLAAALVLVHHAGYDADTLAGRLGRQPLALDRAFDWGFGIHLFFVLSGFIMVYAERDFGKAGASRRFVIRRLIRVVPLYWLMTSLLLLGAWVAPHLLNSSVEGWPTVVGSYLFIPVLRATGDSHPVLGQGWTLAYEMLFYAAFAGAMAWPRPLGLGALVAAFIILVAAGGVAHPTTAALQVWTDPLLVEFLFGVGVALLHDHGFNLGGVAAALVAAAGASTAIAAGPAFGLSEGGPTWILQGIPAALILCGFALGPAWPATLPVRAMSALGDASYSLYLSHPFAIRPLRDLWLHAGGAQWPLIAYFGAACVLALVVSLMLFRFVEQPVTRWLRRWFGTRETGRAGGGTLPT